MNQMVNEHVKGARILDKNVVKISRKGVLIKLESYEDCTY